MGTSLLAITNSKLNGTETKEHWDSILEKLINLKLDNMYYMDNNNNIIKAEGTWEYEIMEPEYDIPFYIEFSGPFTIQPDFYSNLGILHTIYKYDLIYTALEIDWFAKFRKDLFEIVKVMGGTEIIYLADNACDKLGRYYEGMAIGDIPYETIKAKMIEELGLPVTDYAKLDYDKLDYRNITEFFLDDFKDFK